MTTPYDLIAEARAKFGALSAAEEKLLRCAQSGDIAYCGPSEKDDDPGNDPAKADQWGKDRTIRAKLIRWLCVDREASQRIDPSGIQVHAATIGDATNEKELDLSGVDVPFRFSFGFCNFQIPLLLMDARIKALNLAGAHVPGLIADRVSVGGTVFLRKGFQAQGEVSLLGACIDGDLNCSGGTFLKKDGSALSADGIEVGHAVILRRGFTVAGEMRFVGAKIEGQLDTTGAHFGDASTVNLENAIVKQAFFWRGLGANIPARLSLKHATFGPIGDDEQSWPKKGNLFLDGFTYERIGEGPTSAEKRLEWLARQPDGFIPQPYRQLAKVLREAGDDAGARKVLIAMEDSRLEHGGLSSAQKVVSRVLRATVGYGYTPLRALWYIVAFVILGTLLFGWGGMVHVINPVATDPPVARIDPFNPFIYSLENFLPLVDLHMAKYYLPNPNAMPSPLVGPFSDTPFQPRWLGGVLRYYLWLHILLGWFFTSMFIAGVTGLVRRE